MLWKVLSDCRVVVISVLSLQGYLLYRDTTNHSMAAVKINPETLEHEGTVTMPGAETTLCGWLKN